MAVLWDTVAVIGVGAIGASLGLGIRSRELARRVVGSTRSERSAQIALDIGAVDAIAASMEQAAAEAELTIVCTPVMSIADHVRRCAAGAPPDALFTDAGSTKASLCRELRKLPRGAFVGSHPLAGTHEAGPQAGCPDLLVGRTVIMTPADDAPVESIADVRRLWEGLGAVVELMTPAEHDRLLAAASHLPHAVASLLAAVTPADAQRWTASGWRDTTRVAAGAPDLWQQILRDNREHLLDCLRGFQSSLSDLITALEKDDPSRLTELLEQGKRNRDAVGN